MSYSVQNPTAEALLAHADWAHSLARQLVQDVAAADDVVQEAWLAALRSPPDIGGPMRPWLATVLRNAAGQLRRRSASRSRREKAAARPEALPSAAELVEKAESQRGLVDKVLALPAPYRETILLRYFENASAADIARRLDVPAATVRWRLQKGLALLRELLDAERDGDQRAWAMALLPLARAPWAGLTGSSLKTLGAGSALAITGVLIVKKIILPVAVAVLLGLGVWAVAPMFDDAASGNIDVGSEPFAGTPIALGTGQEDLSADEPVARDRVESQAVAKPRVMTVAVVGRCVDENGLPLAGSELKIRGVARNSDEARGKLGLGLVASATSAKDGSFELRLELAANTYYSLRASLAGMLQTRGPLNDFRESRDPELENVDLGDIVMRRGARMRAKVVDQNGSPVSGVSVIALVGVPSFDGGSPATEYAGRSKPDGSLVFGGDPLLMTGSWEMRTGASREIIAPRRLVVPSDSSEFAVQLVVRDRDRTDSISGRVLAESGVPQSGVRVSALHDDRRLIRSIQSANDGSFRIYGKSDAKEPVIIQVEGTGGLLAAYSEQVNWGTSDLELVMRQATGLDLTVVDESGIAVEDFGVAVAWSGDPYKQAINQVEHEGKQPEGFLRVDGVGRGGTIAVLVWPTEDDFALHMPVNVALPENSRARATVTLPRKRPYSFRVVDEAGEPVLGSKVELVQCDESPLSATTEVYPLESVLWNLNFWNVNPERKDWVLAFLLDSGETDSEGRILLRGPRRDRIGLRVTAEDHPPLILYPVTLTDGEQELTVSEVAALRGMVQPGDLEQRFRPDASKMLPPDRRPGLMLRRVGEGKTTIMTSQGKVIAIADDGSFSVESLKAERVEVVLYWWRQIAENSWQAELMMPPLAVVDLIAGQVHELELDLSAHLPGRLTGTVIRNGQPAGHAGVRLTSRMISPRGFESFQEIAGIETDAEGKFSVGALQVGGYALSLQVFDKDHSETWLSAPDWVQVSTGQESDAVFQVSGRAVRVLIKDEAGDPVGERALRIVHQGLHRTWDRKTDADGQVAVPDAPMGTLRVMVLGPGMPMLPTNVRLVRPETELEPIQVGVGSEELVVERVLR